MLIGEIISRIESLYSKGIPSNDSRLSRRYIYNKMVSTRATILFNKSNKRQLLSNWTRQQIPVVLEAQKSGEDWNDPSAGVTLYRGAIPKVLMNINGEIEMYVMSYNGLKQYEKGSRALIGMRKSDKYTSDVPDFFYEDGYLYLTGAPDKDADATEYKVFLRTVFYDPLEVDTFIGNSNYPMDVDFRLDEDLVEVLIDMCVKELVIGFSQMQEDRTSDGTDDAKVAPSPSQTKQNV